MVTYVAVLKNVLDDGMVLDGGSIRLEDKVEAEMTAVHEVELGFVDDEVRCHGPRDLLVLNALKDGQKDLIEFAQLTKERKKAVEVSNLA